jgi:opacity protein-like surface antigen
MKRLSLLMVLALTTASLALSNELFGFGVHANYANLNVAQPLKAVYGSGFGGGLHVDFRFGIVTLRVNGDYNRFGADHETYTNLIYDAVVADDPSVLRSDINVEGGGTIGILSFGANGKFSLPQAQVSPYAIVGIGVATLSITDITATIQGAPATIVTGFSNQTKFMLNAGAGIDFPLGNVALFLEVRYTWIFTDEQSTYLPVTIGVTF